MLQTLLLADGLIPSVWSGAKTGTIRTRHRDIREGLLVLEAAEGTLPETHVEIETVLHTTLAALPDWAILMEG